MRRTETSPSGSEAMSSRIFSAALLVTVTIRFSVYQRVSAGKRPPPCDSCSTRISMLRAEVRDTARTTRARIVWRRDAWRPGRLVSLLRLRLLRPGDPGVDDPHVLRVRHASDASCPRADRTLRVGRLDRAAAAEAAVHDQLLPDGDALHRLRHRDRLSLSGRGDPRAGALVRRRGVRILHRDSCGGLRLRLAG